MRAENKRCSSVLYLPGTGKVAEEQSGQVGVNAKTRTRQQSVITEWLKEYVKIST